MMALLPLPSQAGLRLARFVKQTRSTKFAGDCLRPARTQVGGFFFSVCLPRRALRLSGLALVAGLLSGCAGHDLASIAERHEGRTARQMGVPSSLWCADAVNVWRREAGLRAVPSRRAIDQARAGRRIEHPMRGALMITPRGRGGHHVDLVLAVHGDGTLTVIGGNVGARVSRRVVPARGLFILPT